MSAVGDMVGSIFGGSSSGAGAQQSSSSQSSDSRLDPEIKKLFMENFTRAQDVAGNLGVQQFAPRTADYNNAQALIRNAGVTGANTVGSAVNTLSGLQASNPYSVTGQGYDAMYGNAAQLNGADLSNYMNPYQQAVIDSTMNQMGISRQRQTLADNAAAVKAGAFGGSRQAVQNALSNEAYDRNTASTLAGLNASNFTNAQNAAQSDVANRQAAMLANLGYGNRAAEFGASATNAANLANQSAYNTNQALRLQAANAGVGAGQTQQDMATRQGQNVMNLGLMDQDYQQKILDATRNLPLEQQALINQALSINPAGGAGNVSTGSATSNASTQGQGILGSLGSAAAGFGQAIGPAALAYMAFSDENLKENIEDIKDPLDKLKFLRGTSYNYKGKDYKSAGIIAQDVEKVMPRAVFDTPDGKAVDYTAVTGLLVSAVNDLAAKVEKKGAKHGRAI